MPRDHSTNSFPDLTQPVPEPVMSAGRILSDKRQEWDLTIQEVAANLNLGTDTIEALEADEYETLPGTTFVKGYIRAYARLLKLDVEDLMGNIDLQPERITEIPSTRAALKQKGKTRYRDGKKKKGGGKFLRWVFILIVLVALGGFALSQLSRFGIESISDLFSLQGEQGGEADENQLILPQSSDTGNAAGADSNGGEQRGALIRIE